MMFFDECGRKMMLRTFSRNQRDLSVSAVIVARNEAVGLIDRFTRLNGFAGSGAADSESPPLRIG
jgi:hypothetical protein